MTKLLITIIFIFSTLVSFSQQEIDSSFIFNPVQSIDDTLGSLEIKQDPKVASLLFKKVEVNKAKASQQGYRIQIMSATGANSRDKANMAKAEFLTKFNDIEIYIVYQAPYFKVRLGDFRTKLDAFNYLQNILEVYPHAFVVSDKVNIPLLKKEENNELNIQN